MPSAAGSFMSSFANGFSNERDRKAVQANRELEREDLRAYRASLAADRGRAGSADYGGSEGDGGPSAYAGGNVAPMRASDPAYGDLTPQQKAALNAIAAGESAGKYNVRYTPDGGQTFDLAGGHPRIYENGPAGKSSAAGRYQFTWSTWKGIAGADTPFTPENQDKYAWQLASQDYQKRTGRDLNADINANGFTPEIAHALAPTWTSLNNPGKAVSTYADSVARYSADTQPAASNVVPFQPSQGRSLILPGVETLKSNVASGINNLFPIGR